MNLDSTPARFNATAARLGDRPAYYLRGSEGWEAHSWASYAADVQRAARALISLEIQKSAVVCVLGFNRPEWCIMDHAAMQVGAAPAGIYWTSSGEEVIYILNHSQAPLILIETAEQYAKIAHRLAELPHLRHIVMMRGAQIEQGDALSWERFMALGQPQWQSTLEQRLGQIQAHDIGTLIYTSGTTGPPKAVALTHLNLAWTSKTLSGVYQADENDRLMSYLPLAHIAEQMGTIHNPALLGCQVYFARSLDQLAAHLAEVRPTIFFGVPRVWEKIQAGIQSKLASATGVKANLAHWAMGVSRAWHQAVLQGKSPGWFLGWKKQMASKLVLRKVQQALGFDAARLLTTGAAPISADALEFFTGLDLVIYEVYGQSEVCGPSTVNLPGAVRLGSAGKVMPGMELRIAQDGEILVRGPSVFQCYLGMPDQTAQTFMGDWMCTGDLGRVDEDGFVFITGRKKDLIITSGGKNISPSNIETALMDVPLIEHALVCGDGRHYLTALLTLKPDALAEFAQRNALQGTTLQRHPQVLAALQAAVDQVNQQQARVAHVRKFSVLEQSLTVEQGELTPTLKVRRQVLSRKYQSLIDAMYQEGS